MLARRTRKTRRKKEREKGPNEVLTSIWTTIIAKFVTLFC